MKHKRSAGRAPCPAVNSKGWRSLGIGMQPQVMLFDEATSALDPELVKGILALIADLGSKA